MAHSSADSQLNGPFIRWGQRQRGRLPFRPTLTHCSANPWRGGVTGTRPDANRGQSVAEERSHDPERLFRAKVLHRIARKRLRDHGSSPRDTHRYCKTISRNRAPEAGTPSRAPAAPHTLSRLTGAARRPTPNPARRLRPRADPDRRGPHGRYQPEVPRSRSVSWS